MIFKCVLVIWLRTLTVKISDVPCSGEVVDYQQENWKPSDLF